LVESSLRIKREGVNLEDLVELNNAMLRSVFEVAGVSYFILRVQRSFGWEMGLGDEPKPTRRLRRPLTSTSIKRHDSHTMFEALLVQVDMTDLLMAGSGAENGSA
jgi:hypothetical protein